MTCLKFWKKERARKKDKQKINGLEREGENEKEKKRFRNKEDYEKIVWKMCC
jgi:hypothetical protein